MADRRGILFLLFGTFVALLSVTSGASDDNEVMLERLIRNLDSGKARPKRPSLHELLMKNRNIASVAPDQLSRDTYPPVDGVRAPLEASSVPDEINRNENRRVLVLGDGEEPPNYVYDDGEDDAKEDFTGQTYYSETNVDPGEETNSDDYATNFAGIQLPSYADPNLLAAVMNQADEANFRFPIENRKVINSAKDQSAADSAKIESYSNTKTNDVNPFDLFPSEFHDLLEIPLHVYPNGTSYSPHNRNEQRVKSQSPTIIGGYASTKLSGQNSVREEGNAQDSKLRRIPTRVRRPPSGSGQFESFRIRNKNNMKRITTTPRPVRIASQPDTNRINNYSTLDRNFKQNVNNQQIPSSRPSNRRRRPVRPSLRFRTKAPSTATGPTFSEVRRQPTTESPVPTTNLIRLVNNPTSFNNQKLFHVNKNTQENKEIRIEEQNERPVPEYGNKSYEPTRNFEFRDNIELQKTNDNQRTFDRTTFDAEISHKPVTEPSSIEDESYNIYDRFPAETNPSFVDNKDHHTSFSLSPYEIDNSNNWKRVPENNYQKIKKNLDDRPSKNYHDKTTKTAPSAKIAPNSEFKPSVRDPYFSGQQSPVSQDSGSKFNNYVTPTTFKPHYAPTSNSVQGPSSFISKKDTQHPSFHSPTLNSYERPLRGNQDYVFDGTLNEDGVPFTNSHTFMKPFSQGSFYDPRTAEKEAFHESNIPVYISSPIHRNAAKIISDQYKRFDIPSLNIDLRPPPPNYEIEPHASEISPSFELIPPRRRAYSPVDLTRTTPNRPQRSSFLDKFGLKRVSRRTGISGPKAQINNLIKEKEKKGHRIDYVLSNGPPPVNSQRMVVIGPFKEPPRGAPKIFPHSKLMKEPAQRVAFNPSFELRPPSPKPLSKEESSTRGPSFKVIELPKEDNIIYPNENVKDNDNQVIVVKSKFEVSGQKEETGKDYRQGSVTSVSRFDDSPLAKSKGKPTPRPTFKPKSKTSIKKSIGHPVNLGMKVDHTNYHLFEEVSDADKERLIAAKFEIPRISSVGRSGFQKQLIPIPVPMIESGRQVLNFRNIHMPHSPLSKRAGLVAMESKVNGDRTSEKHKFNKIPSEGKSLVVSPGERLITTTPSSTTTHNTQDISLAKPALEHQSKKISNPEEPQSYREPFVSDITFGGWEAIGESPVVEYVKENIPYVINGIETENKEKTGT